MDPIPGMWQLFNNASSNMGKEEEKSNEAGDYQSKPNRSAGDLIGIGESAASISDVQNEKSEGGCKESHADRCRQLLDGFIRSPPGSLAKNDFAKQILENCTEFPSYQVAMKNKETASLVAEEKPVDNASGPKDDKPESFDLGVDATEFENPDKESE